MDQSHRVSGMLYMTWRQATIVEPDDTATILCIPGLAYTASRNPQ